MPVTVKVNGTANSLVHKGSNHVPSATTPDVCKVRGKCNASYCKG